MFTVKFWRDAAERAISTAAQTLVAVWGVGEWFDLFAVDWGMSGSVAGGAALLSLLKAVVASRVGDHDSAAMLPTYGRHAKRED